MSTLAQGLAAILDDAKVNLTAWPVVRPNEAFDPAAPSGRFSAFPQNGPHVLVEFDVLGAQQETHGDTTGTRTVTADAIFIARGAMGVGPTDVGSMIATINARYRNRKLLSGELHFGEPIPQEVGEVEGWYVWTTRCPFTFRALAP